MKIGVVGVRGAVGREIVRTLEESDAKLEDVRLFGSADKPAGAPVEFRGAEVRVLPVSPSGFSGLDLVIFGPGAKAARELAGAARRAVDCSKAHRLGSDVPLVIDAVNGAAAAGMSLVAVPGAMTITLATTLAPLHRAAGLRRVTATLFEAASGVGTRGADELAAQSAQLLSGRDVRIKRFEHRLAFNLIPQVGALSASGESEEETAVAAELERVLGAPDFTLAATAVRVPIMFGYAASLLVETVKPLDADAARELFRRAPGVQLLDDPAEKIYPMPLLATGNDAALVGRVRAAPGGGLLLFAAQDNIRAVAVNAVAVAMRLARGL